MESKEAVFATETPTQYANRLVVGNGTFKTVVSLLFGVCVGTLGGIFAPNLDSSRVVAPCSFIAGLTGMLGVLATIEHCAHAIVRAIAEKRN